MTGLNRNHTLITIGKFYSNLLKEIEVKKTFLKSSHRNFEGTTIDQDLKTNNNNNPPKFNDQSRGTTR